MHYFVRIAPDALDLASCETDAGVAAIVARGFIACNRATHRAVWQERDRQARREMAIEDEQRLHRGAPAVIVAPERENVVYPSNWKA